MTLRPPCSLRRQDCLIGDEFMNAIAPHTNHNSQPQCAAGLDQGAHSSSSSSNINTISLDSHPPGCSPFEHLFLYPPILDAILLNLPTGSLFDIYHTSKFLRVLLQNYPLAWRNLSFRLLPAVPPATTNSGFDSPVESSSNKRPHALDFLLRFALPSNITLTRLDLDNTSVSGTDLHTNILHPYRAILKHLSVRGCKDVSIKYHIIPFLTSNLTVPIELVKNPLALKSLYTYRCRHHRRRPYLPSSLNRRDSDSHPTHTLVEICHRFSIWTDTAWCPTPGGRCFRRKDYWIGRSGFGASEVWVPFDRLWRSQNFVGPTDNVTETRDRGRHISRDADTGSVGRLWAEHECGHGGEPLGTGLTSDDDGKELPTHLRKSHTAFVEGFKCYACGDAVLERCEQCSVRMHCAGCRKTLCHSCAFDRPMRKKRRRAPEAVADMTGSTSSLDHAAAESGPARRRRRRLNEQFWWAPGATRSPNMMDESSGSDDSSSESDNDQQNATRRDTNPRLDMHWCCLKPSFSGGGGIGFMGTPNGDNVRAAPLPQGRGFEDSDFPVRLHPHSKDASSSDHGSTSEDSTSSSSSHSASTDSHLSSQSTVSTADNALFTALSSPLPPLQNISQPHKSPRSLCADCYNSPTWRVSCKACNMPICIEHDIKQLKARRCGFRKLDQERKAIQQQQLVELAREQASSTPGDTDWRLFLAKWKPIVRIMEAQDKSRKRSGKWAPEDRDVDPAAADDLDSPVSPTTSHFTFPHALRRTKSLTTLPSHTHPSNPSTTSPPSPTLPRQPPRWTGCGAYFCPSPRALGDPRQRCTATEMSHSPHSTPASSSLGNAATSTVTATTNFTTHVANNHPAAMPFVANLGALGNMTLAPGTTMTFLYGPGLVPPALAPVGAGAAGNGTANGTGNANANATGTGNANPQPQAPGNLNAIITHAAGAQQHVRGGVIGANASNEHEALRCVACNVLVCGDCRRESPVCPCSACSPVGAPSYSAAAASAASSTILSASASTASNVAIGAVTGTGSDHAQQNSSTSGASTAVNAAGRGDGVEQFTAHQLCPNCRTDPTIARRCRFAIESARAFTLSPLHDTAAGSSNGSSEGDGWLDEGWRSFWDLLDGGGASAMAEHGTDDNGTAATHTTPPPLPQTQPSPPEIVISPSDETDSADASGDGAPDVVAEISAGDESSADGTGGFAVEAEVHVDADVQAEEDAMGMEG